MNTEEYWQEQFKEALSLEGITDSSFFSFMTGKVKKCNAPWDGFSWGCFPRLDDQGFIRDIRMVVPVICDMKTLLVNLHEYTHAYELYEELGATYIERTEERENKARAAEKRYLLMYDNNKHGTKKT